MSEEKKKIKWGLRIFKTLWFVLFLIATVVWVVFTLDYFSILIIKPHTWPFAQLEILVRDKIVKNSDIREFGFQIVLIAGSVWLAYLTIMFPLMAIPVVGKIIKWFTCSIASFAIIVLILAGLVIGFGQEFLDKFITDNIPPTP